jgi:hypothetical protein
MSREPELERRWLRRVAEEAGHQDPDALLAACQGRLAKGAQEYGNDSFMAKSFPQLVEEALEEGVDFPVWLVLAIQRFQTERDQLPAGAADHVERILLTAAAKVIEGWYAAGLAIEFYREARAALPPPPRRPYSQCEAGGG